MKDRKSRLGSNLEEKLGPLGLDALFGKINNEPNSHTMEHIPIEKIKIAKWQPRKEFEPEALIELSQSIKQHGILQPILVKQENDEFIIIAGERRYRACKIANISKIPAIILNNQEQTLLEISVIENLQRKDLNPVEKAQAFKFLIDKFDLSHEELAKKLGINRSAITNYLRINNLDEEIQQQIASGKISFGHAKILASQENAQELAKTIIEKKLSVRDLEKNTKKNLLNENKTSSSKNSSNRNSSNADIIRFEEMIFDSLKLKTTIEIEKTSGKVIVHFENLEELEAIISCLCI